MTVDQLIVKLIAMRDADPSIGALHVAAASMSTEEIDEATQVSVATKMLRARRRFDDDGIEDGDGEVLCVWIRP